MKERKKIIGVLMGGPSCERDISIKSGKAVCRALENKGISHIPIELEDSSNANGYKKLVISKLCSLNIDGAFIALHGEFGEDGTVQEILEEMNIPYTGSKVLASRLGMDKLKAKDIFKSNNIPVANHKILEKNSSCKKTDLKRYFKELSPRLVVKPSDKGSSIGVAIVDNEADFYSALDNAFKYSDKIIIEEYISGREITVGIVEDRPLPVVEILPKDSFFDFTAKYQKGITLYTVPAKIDTRVSMLCQDIALKAHKALGACSFSRVDMILSDKQPIVLEINTIPGLTETSLLPKAAMAAGINFEELCLKILGPILW